MSWKRFDNLSVTEQKMVLQEVFNRTTLMYDVTTEKGYRALKNEYHNFVQVKNTVDNAMDTVL